jgi:hypothetical protein
MIFVGYESGSKAYCTYDPVTERVHVTRDVVFDEQDQWDWGTDGNDRELGGGDSVFMVEYTTIDQIALETEVADEKPVEQSPLTVADDDTEVENDINDDNFDVDHDDAEVDDDVDNELVRILL